jgi:hypothetical protein
MRAFAAILLVGSAIAFGFLVYSLANLDRLGIGISHPRVLVELGLAVMMLAAGFLLLR